MFNCPQAHQAHLPNGAAACKQDPNNLASADVGNPQGRIVPTAITFHDHAFYLTNLDVFDPGFQNQSRVFRITSDGQLETVAGALNAAVGIAFDQRGRLYVLEASPISLRRHLG